jgi:hypothetical protein
VCLCVLGAAAWSDIRCIATDGCGSFDSVLGHMLPGVDHLRCRFHIYVNISKNVRKKLANKDWPDFIEAYFICLYERSIVSFEALWEDMMTKWPAAAPYMKGELYPCRTKWASAWSEPFTSFGAHSTQRVECMNNLVKQCIRPSYPLTDLFQCIVEISQTQSQTLIDTLSHDKFTKPLHSGPVYVSARRVLTKQAAALLHEEGAWRETYKIQRMLSKPSVCFPGAGSVGAGVHIWPEDLDALAVDKSVHNAVYNTVTIQCIAQYIFQCISQCTTQCSS